MAANTGIACKCSSCPGPQWYANGICQGCNSADNIEYTWIEHRTSPPELNLESGVTNELVKIWIEFVRLRGLTPYLVLPAATSNSDADPEARITFSSAEWYRPRGVSFDVQCHVALVSSFAEDFNRASAWTNKSLLARLIATFEAFAGKGLDKFRLPNKPGMRELHLVRRLRNNFAHGDRRGEDYLRIEYRELLGQEAFSGADWNLAIDSVLEPLWARMLLYAASLEDGHDAMPERPGVVVTTGNGIVAVQSFDRAIPGTLPASSGCRIGDIVNVPDDGP